MTSSQRNMKRLPNLFRSCQSVPCDNSGVQKNGYLLHNSRQRFKQELLRLKQLFPFAPKTHTTKRSARVDKVIAREATCQMISPVAVLSL